MIWQTLYYTPNPEFEYQKRGSNWVKRKRGSNEKFYPVVPSSVEVLNKFFGEKGGIAYQYSTFTKTAVVVAGLLGIYFISKKWNFNK